MPARLGSPVSQSFLAVLTMYSWISLLWHVPCRRISVLSARISLRRHSTCPPRMLFFSESWCSVSCSSAILRFVLLRYFVAAVLFFSRIVLFLLLLPATGTASDAAGLVSDVGTGEAVVRPSKSLYLRLTPAFCSDSSGRCDC